MKSSELAVLADGLEKSYGKTRALDGVDLAVPEGSVCGLLGPNGAGKTTAVRILATLLRSDRGHARVAGFDVERQPREVRARIGLTGQAAAVDEILTGRDNLVMFGRLYRMTKRAAQARAQALLEQFNLTEAAGKPVRHYSGGMRRRLDLAVSLITAPPVLFMDEPTTGLDIRHRKEVWQAIRTLAGRGTTVLLTTHYLEEADQLADQISVIDRGQVIADGTPSQLKAKLGGDRLDVMLSDVQDLGPACDILTAVAGPDLEVDRATGRISASADDRVELLTGVVRALSDAAIPVEDIALRRPSLDEVFLRLTGEAPDGDERPDPTDHTDSKEAAA